MQELAAKELSFVIETDYGIGVFLRNRLGQQLLIVGIIADNGHRAYAAL